jgi:CRISPR-associated endonuclease Cas2
MQRERIETIGKTILLLLGAAAVLTLGIIAPNATLMLKLFTQKDKRLRRYKSQSVRNALYRLRKQKLVSIGEEKGMTVVKITEKGKTRVLKYQIENLKIPRPDIWDQKWRLVIFDIPVNRKLAREILREKLKNLGFYKLQKSVWLYPYPCEKEIDFIKEVYEIGDYVQLVVAEKIDDEEKYKKVFNLR